MESFRPSNVRPSETSCSRCSLRTSTAPRIASATLAVSSPIATRGSLRSDRSSASGRDCRRPTPCGIDQRHLPRGRLIAATEIGAPLFVSSTRTIARAGRPAVSPCRSSRTVVASVYVSRYSAMSCTEAMSPQNNRAGVRPVPSRTGRGTCLVVGGVLAVADPRACVGARAAGLVDESSRRDPRGRSASSGGGVLVDHRAARHPVADQIDDVGASARAHRELDPTAHAAHGGFGEPQHLLVARARPSRSRSGPTSRFWFWKYARDRSGTL